ncbi:hypothetical protein ACTOWA_00565 [Herbaspirillum seropedicae]|uniref:hypothetical protein n=1 Tax=Herbaspirillum seropedicae TaxID=964 RepID=UPI00285F83EB|nr:hypothetical protein [Herbaspirillum seropedicae]MDR6397913.1 hypothetical protein [Herbaspirillum seropedicae]
MPHNNETKYPGWPATYKPATMMKLKPGEGLFESDVALPDLTLGPDPVEVKKWRKENNATVAKTAEFFGLSDVQVLQTTS